MGEDLSQVVGACQPSIAGTPCNGKVRELARAAQPPFGSTVKAMLLVTSA